jgi:hypothetical protein
MTAAEAGAALLGAVAGLQQTGRTGRVRLHVAPGQRYPALDISYRVPLATDAAGQVAVILAGLPVGAVEIDLSDPSAPVLVVQTVRRLPT